MSFSSDRRPAFSAVALALGLSAVMLLIGLPELSLNRTIDEARSCFESFEKGPTAPDDACAERAERWAWLALRTPWVRRRAQLILEEVHARWAVARYVDALVGELDDSLVAGRYEEVERAAARFEGGSARLRLDDLGAPLPAPRAGRLAAFYGDRRTLDAHAFEQDDHDVEKAAIAGALLEADTNRAIRLAEHYHGRPNTDLRVLVGALDCMATEPRSEGPLVEVARGRAAKRSANFLRNFGDARVVLEACARVRRSPVPPLPEEGNAGRLDRFEQRMALALRRWANECDPGHVVPSPAGAMAPCRNSPRAARRIEEVTLRLSGATSLRYRLELVALIAPAFDDGPAFLRVARPHGATERSHLDRIPWEIDEWLGFASSDEPFVLPSAFEAAASRIAEFAAAGDPDKELATLSAVMRLLAARGWAMIGDASRAEAALEGGLVELEPMKGQAQLARSSLAWVLGKPDAALRVLRPEEIGAPFDRAAVRLQRAVLLLPDVNESERELRASLRDLGDSTQSSASVDLAIRARWLLIAIGATDPSLPEPADSEVPPMVGALAGMSPEVRAGKAARALGSWQTWLSAPEAERRALRYRAMKGRGTAPADSLFAHLLLGARLAPPDRAERWLDAFFAVDAQRVSRAYEAWLRYAAARGRGDEAAAATWRGRFVELARRRHDPERAELWRAAGI